MNRQLLVAFAFISMTALAESHYVKLIEGSEKKVNDLTSSYDLLRCAEFIEIYKDPVRWQAEAEQAIISDKLSLAQKHIVIYSMQRLPVDDYIRFLRAVFDGYNKRQVSKLTLMNAFIVDPSWNSVLVENYKNSAVQVLLKDLRGLSDIDQVIVVWIDETLAGKSAIDLKESEDAGAVLSLPLDAYKKANQPLDRINPTASGR